MKTDSVSLILFLMWQGDMGGVPSQFYYNLPFLFPHKVQALIAIIAFSYLLQKHKYSNPQTGSFTEVTHYAQYISRAGIIYFITQIF